MKRGVAEVGADQNATRLCRLVSHLVKRETGYREVVDSGRDAQKKRPFQSLRSSRSEKA